MKPYLNLGVDGWGSSLLSVDSFLRHYRRKTGSEHTRRNVLDALEGFLKSCGRGPEEAVRLEPEEASKMLQDYLDGLRAKGRSVRSLNAALSYLRVFFECNGFKNDRALEVERYYQPARYRKKPEYIPTLEEAWKMVEYSGGIKNRAIILCLLASGLRNSTLRALRYKDVKVELESGREVVMIPVYPEMKEVVADACKGNIPYYTFLPKEATEALRLWLREREEKLGPIKDDNPLFNAEFTRIPKERWHSTPIGGTWLQVIVKKAAKRAGLERWRDVYPHCLRKTFESALRNAGLDVKDQEFLMGHILPGSQDTYYDKTKVEELRRKYSRIRFSPAIGEETKKIAVLEAMRAVATSFGIDPMKIRIEKQKELGREATSEEEIELIKLEMKKMREPKEDPQMIVKEEELESHLKDGWQFVSVLPSEKILIRK